MSAAESPRHDAGGSEPSDPLLKSGCFIDPSETGDPETPVPGTPNNLGDSSSNGADVAADSIPDGVTQSNGTTAADNRGSASAEDSKVRRRIRPPTDAPDWLPKGWIVEDRVRTSGATAGSIDKYYCDPVSKHVFRSKNEVLHYVQIGTRLKRKKNVDNPDGEAMVAHVSELYLLPLNSCALTLCQDANGSGRRKQKKAAVPSSPPTLDFENVPTVTWVLKDRAKDSWVPHMYGHEVPKSVQQQWSAAFSWITSKSR